MDKINQFWQKTVIAKLKKAVRILGGHPIKYWTFAVCAWFVLFLTMIAVNGFIFLQMKNEAFRQIFVPDTIEVRPLDKEQLEKAVAKIKAREAEYERIISGVSPAPAPEPATEAKTE